MHPARLLLVSVLLLPTVTLAASPATPPQATVAPSAPDRLAWWQDARFGMFIHFGVYSSVGRGEWVRSVERMSVEAYEPFFKSFNPVDFDARALARQAKAAGMKYAVMTAKHHDGFCLFDSRLTDYKSTRTPAKRDLVKEFLDAFRAEGLRVGLYYSLLDWHHPDYPHHGDNHHPERDNDAWKGRKHDFPRYLDYMHAQVKELVTKYGRLDILWFDFAYGQLRGEAWRGQALVKMVRQAQPHIILNNRLDGDGVTEGVGSGDFVTPEQGIPAVPPRDGKGKLLPWETCLTLNNSWGYNRRDTHWKSPRQVISALVNVVSKGGNLLLNVGPDGRGRIPEASLATLRDVGRWLSLNGESIYRAGPAALDKPDWGRLTQRGSKLYAHILEQPIGHIVLPGMRGRVMAARLLADGSEAYIGTEKFGQDSGDELWLNVAKPVHHTYTLPDPLDTVIELELK